MSVYDNYEMTIGVECHVQLDTKTKLFSSSNNDARDKSPNSTINEVDWALPGMLPVLNKQAVILAVRAAEALGAKVNKVSRFDRKHYFYPDLPKGYQTSQFYQPIIGAGVIKVPCQEGDFKVRIEHAHLEEDAGKLTHVSDYSLVDLNRGGTPLIEIVTMPDIHSAKQARAFAVELHRLMTFAGVTIGDLYNGNMRFDVNISVAKKGAKKLGKRAEIKNLNSFKSVERAAEYEFYRQVDLLEAGKEIARETRGFDESKQKTFSQRSKEEAQDYRYMPDPDVPPIVLSDKMIDKILAKMPKLPNYYRAVWQEMKLDHTVIDALLSSPDLARAIDAIYQKTDIETTRRIAFWFLLLNEQGDADELVRSRGEINDKYLIELSKMVDANELSSTAAKEVFLEMQTSNDSPRAIAERKQLIQTNDDSAIEAFIDEVLASEAGQNAVRDIQAGNVKAMGFIVGQVMKVSKGQANPQIVQKILRDKLK
ncbi:MAG: Asp-tRNA(Asn)/Glu-tRNA(Gln) amidotransferase subunit GatB [Candidatus Nanosyncoccaceae bacterium]|jgi:aspartyl-tRNA(Asn)/glutamyl-tRNA(Gln) amidotransferase subunit B